MKIGHDFDSEVSDNTDYRKVTGQIVGCGPAVSLMRAG